MILRDNVYGSLDEDAMRRDFTINALYYTLDNFRVLRGYGWPGFKSQKLWRQDKGQTVCAQTFVDAIAAGNNAQLIPFSELVEVASACLDVVDQIR